MKRSIFLFRHGQSTYNRDSKFTGWIDAKLTAHGIADARKVAEKLKGKKIGIAFHSGLARSRDTLAEVLRYHPDVDVREDKRIIERDYGELSGKKKTVDAIATTIAPDMYAALVKAKVTPKLSGYDKREYLEGLAKLQLHLIRRSYAARPPGGESVKDVEARVKPFIKDLLALMRSEKVNVAISAHGNSMRPFRRYFEKLGVEEMMALENPWDDFFEYTIDV